MVEEASQRSPPVHEGPAIEISTATARVPDAVGRGVFATAVVVLHGPNETMIDFVQSLVRPGRVAARVVLPPLVMTQFAAAIEQALSKYTNAYGSLPREPGPPSAPSAAKQADDKPVELEQGRGEQPAGPTARQKDDSATGSGGPPTKPPPATGPGSPPPIEEIYENLKLPDEMLGGVYANVVSISHSGSEFCFDFITRFFPRSVVTARVYMAAPRVPELLGSLKRSLGTG